MPTVAVTLDLSCCRCRVKMEKILCSIQDAEGCGFVFDKVEYEKGKVMITGNFDAIELCCKIRCKARYFVTKVEIVQPKREERKDEKPKEDKTKPDPPKVIPCPYPYPYPYPCPQPACPPPTCPTPPCTCDFCKLKPPPRECCRLPPPPPVCPVPQPPCPFPRPPCGYQQRDLCGYEEPDGSCTVM